MGTLIYSNNFKYMNNGVLRQYSSGSGTSVYYGVQLVFSSPVTTKSGSTLTQVQTSTTSSVSTALSYGSLLLAGVSMKKFVNVADTTTTLGAFICACTLGTTDAPPTESTYNPSDSYKTQSYVHITYESTGTVYADGDVVITLHNPTASNISFNNLYFWFIPTTSINITSTSLVLLATYRFDSLVTLAPDESKILHLHR